MKKILTLVIMSIAALSLVSCKDGGNDGNSEPVFEVRPERIDFDAETNETQDIYVISSSDVSWKAEVDAEAAQWLKITTENDKVVVSVENNATEAQRVGKITVTPSNSNLKAAEVSVTQSTMSMPEINLTSMTLVFYGDYYNCGYSNYYLILGSGDAEYVEDEGVLVENGYLLVLDLFTDEIANEDYQKIEIDSGTYKCGMDPTAENFEYEKMSFIKTVISESQGAIYYDGSLLLKYENGEIADRFAISDGKMNVDNDNGKYNNTIDLLTTDHRVWTMTYSGEPAATFNNVSYSTHMRDINLTDLDTATMDFYGEEGNAGCYRWILMIEVPGYNDISEIMLTLFSPVTSTTILDNGTYDISDMYPYVPFMAESGWAFFDMYGCWVLGYTGSELTDYSPLMSGTVDVANLGADVYTIEVDAVLDNYFSFKASYEGEPVYTNMTTPSPSPAPAYGAVPAKKVISIDGLKGKVVKTEPRYNK